MSDDDVETMDWLVWEEKREVYNERNKQKTFWKIAIITLALILVVVIAAFAWIETYWVYIDENVFDEEQFTSDMEDYKFCVKIKDEYSAKFISGEMTIEEFGWNNLDQIVFDE